MPHIRFRALKEECSRALSDTLVAPLAQAMNTTEDNFTFEHIGTRFFYRGKETESYPFVEVLWFARSRDIQRKAAAIITDHVRAATKAKDVVVVFQALPEADYFENGEHF
jgi:hypothetical protein